jgi:hypothetical protein
MKHFAVLLLAFVTSILSAQVVHKEYYDARNKLQSEHTDTVGSYSVQWGGIIETYQYNYRNQLTSYEYYCAFNDEDTSGIHGYRAWKRIKYNVRGDTDEIFMSNTNCAYGQAKTIFHYDEKKRLTRREAYDLCASDLHFITIQDHLYSADGKSDSINSRKINEDSPEADKTIRYDILIYKGDSVSSLGYYHFALLYYAEAEKIKPGEKNTQTKIDWCNHILSINNGIWPETTYRDLVAAGDFSFAKKDYQSSKAAYEKALLIKPNDQYLQEQLAKCEELPSENKK